MKKNHGGVFFFSPSLKLATAKLSFSYIVVAENVDAHPRPGSQRGCRLSCCCWPGCCMQQQGEEEEDGGRWRSNLAKLLAEMQRGFQRRLLCLSQSCSQSVEALSELLGGFPCVIFLLCLPLRHLHNTITTAYAQMLRCCQTPHTHAHARARARARVERGEGKKLHHIHTYMMSTKHPWPFTVITHALQHTHPHRLDCLLIRLISV